MPLQRRCQRCEAKKAHPAPRHRRGHAAAVTVTFDRMASTPYTSMPMQPLEPS
jgi:hypothetical protein